MKYRLRVCYNVFPASWEEEIFTVQTDYPLPAPNVGEAIRHIATNGDAEYYMVKERMFTFGPTYQVVTLFVKPYDPMAIIETAMTMRVEAN